MNTQNIWYHIQSFFLSLLSYHIYASGALRDTLIKDLEIEHQGHGSKTMVINYFHNLDKPYRRYELWLKT
jgi:hypothetical protein